MFLLSNALDDFDSKYMVSLSRSYINYANLLLVSSLKRESSSSWSLSF